MFFGGSMFELILRISRYALPALTVIILILCFSALFKRRAPSLGNAVLISLANGDAFELSSRDTSIGRHKNCDIVLNYPTVSRQHAVIVCSKKGWYIASAKNSADVLVNGKKIEKKAFLNSGDKITIGSVALAFKNEQVK